MTNCNICVNVFTDKLRKPIKCNNCNFICCLKCFKTYIIEKSNFLKCMSCKNIFNEDFLYSCFSKYFMKSVIIKMITENEENIIFETEKKYLINTQKELDLEKKQYEIKTIINEQKKHLNIINDDLEYAIQESLIFELEDNMKNLSFNYIKKCGNITCNGMLSNEVLVDKNYLCTICNTITCIDCEVILSKKEHICDKNILKNLTNLKEETKPCPSCSVRIYKTEGCDQMYCVQCFTVFSWDTGVIDNGVIHNPEYFDSLKNYNRNPLDIQCGRELENAFYNEKDNKYNKLVTNKKFRYYFCAINNSILYISKKIKLFSNDVSINKKHRIKYLNGVINEKKYKKLCLKNIINAKREKNLLDIVITFMNCGNEIFFRIFYHWDNITKNLNDIKYKDFIDELVKFTSLCNEEFNKISIKKKDLYNLSFGLYSFENEIVN